MGVLVVGWVQVCPGARGCNENHDCELQLWKSCARIPSCASWGATLHPTNLGVPLGSEVCWALHSAPLGDAPAPLGRGESGGARPPLEPPEEFGSRCGTALPSPTVLPGSISPRFIPVLQVPPTRPAAPPCTPSAPSAASTSWASAPSRTGCTSAPTLSPVQTSGTRLWPSRAAAPTPVSSPSSPSPLSCSRQRSSFRQWGSSGLCPVVVSPDLLVEC